MVDPALTLATLEVESVITDWGSGRPDVDLGSLRVFIPLRRALQRAEVQRAEVLARYDLTPAMLDMLVLLRGDVARTPSKLARHLVVTAGGITQRLDRLEQSGLVDRNVDVHDRRRVDVVLTAAGRRVLDDLLADYMANEERLLHAIPPRDQKLLADLLLRLNASIATATTD